MKLYLVQHGEALPREADPDRPLSETGRADVGRLADTLARREVRAGRVVHSGKTRARQTADALARAMTPGAASEARTGLDPNDPTDAIAAEAAGWTGDVVLVGHLPFMARLASRLVTGRDDSGVVAFRPGAMLCLERGDDGAWSIAWLLRPEVVGD